MLLFNKYTVALFMAFVGSTNAGTKTQSFSNTDYAVFVGIGYGMLGSLGMGAALFTLKTFLNHCVRAGINMNGEHITAGVSAAVVSTISSALIAMWEPKEDYYLFGILAGMAASAATSCLFRRPPAALAPPIGNGPPSPPFQIVYAQLAG